MKYSQTVQNILQAAYAYAREEKLAYLTPEVTLLCICSQEEFNSSYTACGGDTETLRSDLVSYIEENIDSADGETPVLSALMEYILSYAAAQAANSAREEIDLRHIIYALCQTQDCYASYYLLRQGVDSMELLQAFTQIEQGDTPASSSDSEHVHPHETGQASVDDISLYAPCLNDTLKNTNPLIGREEELDRTMQILCRKDKNNPLHIGEPGVGKTAITYGLVKRLCSGNVPDILKGSRVYMLDLSGMLAGTQFRGEFEKRFKRVLSEISKEEKPIIYIDEIHNLAGAGATGDGSMDASNLLKPYLSEGHIRFIGATTFEEYKRYFEKNKSLVRRFQNVEILEPSEEETIRILEGLRPLYEAYHGVRYAPDVLPYAVAMARKHIHERFLPDKAIDLIDEAGSYRKLHPLEQTEQVVDIDLINQVLTSICRIPIETVDSEDLSSLATLESRIKQRVFGQDAAVTEVVNAVKFSKAGLLQENKPLASLLFVGPTGVGKTEVARTLAQELGVRLLRFDMSEYEEKHAVAKLIGSPAGYVGYEDGGLLTEAVRKNPSAVLLLDEIEKAHPDIYNVLLQVMDYATLTDNQGRKADFSHITLIMTSNAGASRIGKGTIGFGRQTLGQGVLMEEVKNVFQPEFRNRLDKIVLFRNMDEDMARKIVLKKLSELKDSLLQKNVYLNVDKDAEEKIRANGISEQFGAREVDRVIRSEIKPLFVDEMLFGRLAKGGRIRLTAEEDKFRIRFEDSLQ